MWLDQNYSFPRRRLAREPCMNYRREDECNRDKGDIDGDEVDRKACAGMLQLFGRKIPRVGLFQQRDPWVRAHAHCELPITSINGNHARGAICSMQSLSRRWNPDIHAVSTGEVNLPVLQRRIKLHSAPADIFHVFA